MHFHFITMKYNDKQVQIMEAAEEMFAENGFTGTSIRDISEKAGINISMISYYFGSKEKLLEALFTYRGETSVLAIESLLHDNSLAPLEKVYRLIDYYINKFQNQTCFHKIMSREQVRNRHSAVTELIRQLKQRNQKMVTELVQQGQQSGDFKKDTDIPVMMSTLIGTVSQMITTQHYYREMNGYESMPDEDFKQLLKDKLSQHLKFLFKSILTNEA